MWIEYNLGNEVVDVKLIYLNFDLIFGYGDEYEICR